MYSIQATEESIQILRADGSLLYTLQPDEERYAQQILDALNAQQGDDEQEAA